MKNITDLPIEDLKDTVNHNYDSIERFDLDQFSQNVTDNLMPGIGKAMVSVGKLLQQDDVKDTVSDVIYNGGELFKEFAPHARKLWMTILNAVEEYSLVAESDAVEDKATKLINSFEAFGNVKYKHPILAGQLKLAVDNIEKFHSELTKQVNPYARTSTSSAL